MKRKIRLERTKIPGILRVAKNKFLVRVQWVEPSGRRRKREQTVSTFAEAVLVLEQMRAERSAAGGRRVRMRFSDFAECWLRRHAPRLAPSTRERFLFELTTLVKAFGPLYLDGISAGEIRAWQAREAGRFSPATVNSRLRLLRQVFEDARVDGLVAGNPAKAVRQLTEKPTGGRRGQTLEPGQFKRLLETIDSMAAAGELAPDVARMLTVAAWTGLRLGELLALAWHDIAGAELVVCRAIWRGQQKTTKTGEPRRVPLAEPARAALAEQRRWLVEQQHPGLNSGLCFPADPSHALAGARRRAKADIEADICWYRSPTTARKALLKVCCKAGLPEVSPHALRRALENLGRLAGLSDIVRRTLAGWRTSRAQAIYAGVGPAERQAAVDRILHLVSGVENA